MTYIDNIKEKNLSDIMRAADAFPMDKIVERYAKDNKSLNHNEFNDIRLLRCAA
ncbi:hypothetical protein [Ochrobactrum sp. S1502_03]|uniref:hypothetical protein n=1 Tax=Ochrobactrum sp. S1502_03 TaxID=3108451 RepID=UPI0037CB91B2